MHFTGTTVLKVVDGKIVEEIGLDDGVTALTQLGLIKKSEHRKAGLARPFLPLTTKIRTPIQQLAKLMLWKRNKK